MISVFALTLYLFSYLYNSISTTSLRVVYLLTEIIKLSNYTQSDLW